MSQELFPYWPTRPDCDYQDEKEHAERLDRILGLRASDGIEETIKGPVQNPHENTHEDTNYDNSTNSVTTEPHVGSKNQASTQQWRGLALQSLLTPYTELRRILADLDARLSPGHLVEMGAGYSRFAHVLHACSPQWTYCGYEVVPERHAEAVRWRDSRGLPSSRYDLQCVDLRSHPLPAADVYFMYDYSDRASVEATISQLQERARRGHQVMVVGRGGLTRSIIEKSHPWLANVVEPFHRSRYSIYQS